MRKKPPRLVLIEWYDSSSCEDWTRRAPDTKPMVCQSVGWLVHDGKRAKTLAPNMTVEDDPQRCCEMTIPTVAVKRIRRLKT